MKSTIIITLVISITILYSCYDEKPGEARKLEVKNQKTATFTSTPIPDLSSDYLVTVFEKQELIKISQDDKELRKKYCDESFLEEHKLFISMGIGSLRNPNTGEPIPNHLAERAANLDARRWASYGETWLKNNYQSSFGKLETNFQRIVTIIDKLIVGDSLFIFVATSLP
ncbi:MAG: hypothetical protein KAS58_03465 [Calditrichia bacterium]|nr:hypothetical protein [Calditrichia bacterium]